jgi:hypothetical protein
MNAKELDDAIHMDFPYAVNVTVVDHLNQDIDDESNLSTISGSYYVADEEGLPTLYVEDEFSDKTFVLPFVVEYESLPNTTHGVKMRVATNSEGRRYVLSSNVPQSLVDGVKRSR